MRPNMQTFGDELQKIAADDAKRRGMGWRVPLAVGGATAAGAIPAGLAYLLMRRFKPAVEPGMRALQEAAAGKALTVSHEMSPGRAAEFGRGWGDYLKNLGRAALQRDKEGVGRAVKGMPWWRDMTPVPKRGWKTRTPEALEEAAKQARDKVVVPRYPGAHVDAPGAVNINAGPLRHILDDKWLMHQYLSGKPLMGAMGKTPAGTLATVGAGVEHLLPKTRLLSEALESVGGDAAKLKTLFDDAGYLIKPRTGAMGRGESFVQDITPVTAPQFQEVLKDPGKYIIQKKLPAGFKEYRVHTLADKPLTATHRFLPESLQDLWHSTSGSPGGGGAFMPVLNPLTRRGLKDTARKAATQTQVEGGRLSAGLPETHFAWDIAKLPDGTFKIIEANPYPGTMRSPFVMSKLEGALAGKTPRFVAAPAAAGVGLAGTGVAAGATVPLSLIGSKKKGE